LLSFFCFVLRIVMISSLALFNPRAGVLGLMLNLIRRSKNVVSPAPSQELTELLKDQKIQDASSSNFIVVVTG
jgi:hypothetical protein